ncbi:hypothetical protein MKQ68_01520 [Chitinophaga horti]|uniref:DUF4397 domain-containing protein n=1 Tax=Chitinophaga horti TaxID=2920382 RepID=A0ABY6J6I6_9BACT|nr:hypothetical protein [Chitinophaga horti]UYQ93774.1 hypothetical protein MKQ68_01520 [Chitinophaga horti]
MLRTFTIGCFILLCVITACKKGTAVEEYYFSSLSAELLELPGTPVLDVYFNDTKIDTLKPGAVWSGASAKMMGAGKEVNIIFKRKGTSEVLLDTTVTPAAGQTVKLKFVCSSDLGLKEFISLEPSKPLGTDTATIRLFNTLPEELVADSILLDAIIYSGRGAALTQVAVFPNLEKNKVHSNIATIPLKDATGRRILYWLKFRNARTGVFIKSAAGVETQPVSIPASARYLLVLSGIDDGGGLNWTVTGSELPF